MRGSPSALNRLAYLLLDAAGVNALFRFANRGRVKVLLYHRLDDLSDFRSQMEHLKARFNPVSLNSEGDWVGLRSDKVNVLVTFDDGFRTDQDAARILDELGIRACFFVVSDCLRGGRPPAYYQAYLPPGTPSDGLMLSPGDAAGLVAAGHVVGTHSRAHEDYSAKSPADALADAARSAADIGELLNIKVRLLALPWGRSPEGGAAAFLSSFARVMLTDHGFNAPGDRLLRRNESTSRTHLAAAASGSLDAVKALVSGFRSSPG